MPDVSINGETVQVPEGYTVAAVVMRAGVAAFRHSVSGEPRAALCGMGICFECRVTIDGHPHRLACQTVVTEGMRIETT